MNGNLGQFGFDGLNLNPHCAFVNLGFERIGGNVIDGERAAIGKNLARGCLDVTV